MSAVPKDLAVSARLADAMREPFPNSSKIHVEGSRADIRVPMRQVSQANTPATLGVEKNPPITIYDCSGPYTDPGAAIDLRAGLPALRAAWIAERNDSEQLDDFSSEFGRERHADNALTHLRFPELKTLGELTKIAW